MTLRQDADVADWPPRPWIMAAICAVAGLTFSRLTDHVYPVSIPVWKQAAATFVAVASVSFVLTVEQRRWLWALAFAAGWGLVVALVGWFTARYNLHSTIFEFPFLSGVFAVLLAAPLFQTLRDEGRWNFPYPRLHGHAWTDAVIGAAAIAFIGVSFLLAWLIAGLFDLIGIELLTKLLRKDWFGWMLAGFAFGGAVGLLRERDALVGTLQRLVMVVFSVLAPVLAAALVLFLLSLPLTGLAKLWASSLPTTPMMLLAAAGAVLLANAVIGNGADDRPQGRLLTISAQALVLCVLPLAVIAALSLGQRIGQYGWTPERIWGVVAAIVAIAYGLAAWWVVAKGRNRFDDLLRPLQTRLAIGLCGLALFLALPILDFGAISAGSQVARLARGKIPAAEFDWQAMAFDFGPAGRRRLAEIARGGPADQRPLAAAALRTNNRHDVRQAVEKTAAVADLDRWLRVVPEGSALDPSLRGAIGGSNLCRMKPCVLLIVDSRRAILAGRPEHGDLVRSLSITRGADGKWDNAPERPSVAIAETAKPTPSTADLRTAPVELRTVERRQLFIDGQPVGEPID